jgi:uncharacterized delta-60 repeat protein
VWGFVESAIATMVWRHPTEKPMEHAAPRRIVLSAFAVLAVFAGCNVDVLLGDLPTDAGAPDAASERNDDAGDASDNAPDARDDGAPADGSVPDCAIAYDAGPSGTFDETFAAGLTDLHISFAPRAAAIDGLGRIYVAATAFDCAGDASSLDIGYARFTAAGALDVSYADGGVGCVDLDGLPEEPYAAAVDSKGRLVVAGAHTLTSTTGQPIVARIAPDGALDTTFNAAAGANAGRVALAPPSTTSAYETAFGVFVGAGDGIYVLGGDSSIYDSIGATRFVAPNEGFVFRLAEDGSVDTGFSGRGDKGYYGYWGAAPAPGGLFVVTGATTSPIPFSVRKVGLDGADLTSFGVGGVASVPVAAASEAYYVRARSVDVGLDGSILVSGHALGQSLALARFTAGGALDTSFASSGVYVDPDIQSDQEYNARPAFVQCDGRTVIAGRSGSPQVATVRRLLPSGVAEPGPLGVGIRFPAGASYEVGQGAVFADPRDGKIVVVAGTTLNTGPFLARLYP